MTSHRFAALLAAATLALAGCSSDPAPADPDRIVLRPAADGAGHTHAPGQGHGGSPLGDGLSPRAGGYELVDVALPAADRPGPMSFRIVDESGAVVSDYVEEQTKELHLYVVRADLSAFRHLHPTLDDDGTWHSQVGLGTGGTWRVIAEFTPVGEPQAFVLGSTVEVPGDAPELDVPRGPGTSVADDGVVRIQVLGQGEVSADGRLRVAVTDIDGRPLSLGSYLGASAHLTGFLLDADSSGGFVHVHPYGSPDVTEDGTILTFHTGFTRAGDYRMFVQVRVDGLLHQSAVTVRVS